MEQTYTCIIPARYKSSRFPGKPLELIHGKPMILWCIEHANAAERVKEAIVATDDERIYKVVEEAGYKAIYTSEDCPNGSARVAEASESISDEWVFEMQGDQPLVTPDVVDDFIDRSCALVEKNKDIDVVIPYAPASDVQTESPDVLKVVKTESDRLVFQTRQPIQTGWRTLGLYLWRKDVLQKFASLPVSDIEQIEDSHPIRLYVNDFYVQGLFIDSSSWVEVDRPHQIAEVESLMATEK
ncbi:MAG: NTP transferase domain-containing protein [Bacteroidota bacterium]